MGRHRHQHVDEAAADMGADRILDHRGGPGRFGPVAADGGEVVGPELHQPFAKGRALDRARHHRLGTALRQRLAQFDRTAHGLLAGLGLGLFLGQHAGGAQGLHHLQHILGVIGRKPRRRRIGAGQLRRLCCTNRLRGFML
jgi:hypothetical protein